MSTPTGRATQPVAVIGMAGRFPGASTVPEFWANLLAGVEAITFYDEDELRAAGVPESALADPDYIRANPVIEGADEFDAEFFGVSAREAEVLDPQHRVLLQVTADALANAGYDPFRFPDRIGIFAGSARNEYYQDHVLASPGVLEATGSLVGMLSNDTDYLATGIAYRLDLRGPAVTMVTACSTSLVGVHYACRALQNGECEMAVAGGVEIRLPLVSGYPYAPGSIFSPDGRVRAFDAAANGTVFGAGAAILVLKPLAAALADRDTILTVIRGSAVTNDGADKSAFSAPSPAGQQRAVLAALAEAEVDPATVGYVEAHGTGTAVGDPLELAALATAYGGAQGQPGRCAISSVKSNVGHLGAAAGVTGFIKAAQCLRTGLLPPVINVDRPNPALDLEHGMFRINSELETWGPVSGADVRRAGVSSFGIGGTNAHLILEQPPAPAPAAPADRPVQLLALSARTSAALDELSTRLGADLGAQPDRCLADVAHTLAVGRKECPVRRVVVARDTATAVALLDAPERLGSAEAGAARRATLLFPGQGAQYPGMGRGLYASDPVFREVVDACAARLIDRHGLDLLGVLFAEGDAAVEQLARTEFTQPALFVVEYAMARSLQSWGVDVADMAGHSIGEYVAATVSGVFHWADALDLVVDRGRLMQALPAGAMLAVPLPEDLVSPLLPPTLDVAVVNGPDLTVVAGPADAVEDFALMVAALGASARPVRTSHAFHSAMMEPILDEFTRRVAAVDRHAPQIPFVSNVTGDWITEEQATDPAYWARHLRRTVRFGETLALLAPRPNRLLVEAGPGRTLTTFASAVAGDPEFAAVPTMRVAQQTRDDVEVALEAVGTYWSRGGLVDWERHFRNEARSRVPLPGYPFARTRYWLTPPPATVAAPAAAVGVDSGPFTMPTWTQVPTALAGPAELADLTGRVYLVLSPAAPSALDGIVDQLRGAGARVLVGRAAADGAAAPSGAPDALAPDTWTVGIGEPADVAAVVKAAAAAAVALRAERVHLVHGWTLGERPSDVSEANFAPTWVERGFVGALVLLQQAARHLGGLSHDLTTVSSGIHQVTAHCATDPAKAALLGLLRTAVKEFEGLDAVRGMDLDPVASPRDRIREDEQLYAFLVGTDPEDDPAPEAFGWFEAIRAGQRWRMGHTELTLDAAEGVPDLLVDGGVYLITGGLGGLGLAVAAYLAGLVRARLVLLGRTPLPPREEWDDIVAAREPDDPTVSRITGVRAAEAAGAEVLVLAADVTERADLVAAREQAERRFGRVDGIFHLAALPGGAMLETRDLDLARQVFRPKVEGVYLLEEVFAPDLLVAFSSIAAITGDFGLGDYSSANAVLDAFAQSRWAQGRDVVSVNLPPWEEVGMAFSIDSPVVVGELSKGEVAEFVDHPLLSRKVARTGGGFSFGINLSHRCWVLSDHLMGQVPTMPGTGLIEVLRAATAAASGQPQVEISDLMIARPLRAVPRLSARLELQPRADGGFTATVLAGLENTSMSEYARATVRPLSGQQPPVEDLAAVRAECLEVIAAEDVVRVEYDYGILRFGAHWDNLVGVRRSTTMELVESRLPAELADDHTDYGLNPAQLDICMAVGQTLVPDGGYLPFGYERITVYGPLPQHCFGIIRQHPERTPGQSSADVVVVDEAGRAVVAIDRFTMVLVEEDEEPEVGPTPAAANRAPIDVGELLDEDAGGVLTVEGLEGLRRILLSLPGPQVVWSAEGVRRRIRASGRVDRAAVTQQSASAAVVTATGRRPLSTPVVPPSTPSEVAVCELWQEALGIIEVGVEDDFFDLGGNSLTAVQLVSRITDRFNTRLAVFELFDARTPRVLAEQIDTKLLEAVLALSEDEATLALAQLDRRG